MHQLHAGGSLHVARRFPAEAVQFLRGFLPHAGDFLNRQTVQEGGDFRRRQHELPVRFAPVGGHFRQKFVWGDAGRCGQPGLLEDLRADLTGHVRGIRDGQFVVRYVQIGFVQSQRLDQVGVLMENLMNLP